MKIIFQKRKGSKKTEKAPQSKSFYTQANLEKTLTDRDSTDSNL